MTQFSHRSDEPPPLVGLPAPVRLTADTAGQPSAATRHAAEWGLAALLMGGVLVIIAPVTLIFNLLFWTSGRGVLSTGDMRLAVVFGVVGVIALVGLSIASVCFGSKALQSASINRQPAGLALAGTLVSLLALVLWLITGTDLIMILFTFAR